MHMPMWFQTMVGDMKQRWKVPREKTVRGSAGGGNGRSRGRESFSGKAIFRQSLEGCWGGLARPRVGPECLRQRECTEALGWELRKGQCGWGTEGEGQGKTGVEAGARGQREDQAASFKPCSRLWTSSRVDFLNISTVKPLPIIFFKCTWTII